MGQRYPAAALSALARLLEPAGPKWIVGGSAGLAVRGAELDRPPRDLDLYADEEDVAELHELLAAFAADTPELSETGKYRSILSHYAVGGTVVELVGGFRIRAEGCSYRTEVKRMLYPAGDTFDLEGRSFRLVPPAHELIFNALRERDDRCRIAGRLMRQDPKRHLPVLEMLLSENAFPGEMAERIRQYAGNDSNG